MLFNFELLPLDSVAPWGAPETQSLHWFGLTDGRYWIEVGGQTLFEFIEAPSLAPRYFEYQVARLSDDLLDMLPHVMNPVPADLIPYIASAGGKAWAATTERWQDCAVSALNEDHLWRLAETEHTWRLRRMLVTIPSIDIRIWSDPSSVFMSWDTENEERRARGNPTWTATTGTIQLPREQFIAELRSFHAALVNQMKYRVEQVLEGALPDAVNVDRDLLRRTQADESARFDLALSSSPPDQDWDAVRKAIAFVEQWTRLHPIDQLGNPGKAQSDSRPEQ